MKPSTSPTHQPLASQATALFDRELDHVYLTNPPDVAEGVFVAMLAFTLTGEAATRSDDGVASLPPGRQGRLGPRQGRPRNDPHARAHLDQRPLAVAAGRAGATEPPPDGWGYFKVPGSWPGITDYMQNDCQTLYPHPAGRTSSSPSVTAAWYQREITVPAGWTGRRIALPWST